MEEFVFAGNRRRWRFLGPIVAAVGIGLGLWLSSLCWLLLRSPALPDLGLEATGPAGAARAELPAHGPQLPRKAIR